MIKIVFLENTSANAVEGKKSLTISRVKKTRTVKLIFLESFIQFLHPLYTSDKKHKGDVVLCEVRFFVASHFDKHVEQLPIIVVMTDVVFFSSLFSFFSYDQIPLLVFLYILQFFDIL